MQQDAGLGVLGFGGLGFSRCFQDLTNKDRDWRCDVTFQQLPGASRSMHDACQRNGPDGVFTWLRAFSSEDMVAVRPQDSEKGPKL